MKSHYNLPHFRDLLDSYVAQKHPHLIGALPFLTNQSHFAHRTYQE